MSTLWRTLHAAVIHLLAATLSDLKQVLVKKKEYVKICLKINWLIGKVNLIMNLFLASTDVNILMTVEDIVICLENCRQINV